MDSEAKTLTYATPTVRPPRTAPLAVIMFTGLGLIALGGCFLIGVMEIIHPTTFQGTPMAARLTYPQIVFICALSLLALGSFTGAIVLIVIGTRGLLRLIQN
jgi:hypothetical protein